MPKQHPQRPKGCQMRPVARSTIAHKLQYHRESTAKSISMPLTCATKRQIGQGFMQGIMADELSMLGLTIHAYLLSC